MREIKFRAWDEKAKKMVELGHPFYHDEVGGVLMYAPFPFERYDNWDKLSPFLMQYTGLHDKNGKEIYEGDIIQFDVKDSGIEPETFRWEVKVYTLGNVEPYNLVEGWVIGNIYENADLLSDHNKKAPR